MICENCMKLKCQRPCTSLGAHPHCCVQAACVRPSVLRGQPRGGGGDRGGAAQRFAIAVTAQCVSVTHIAIPLRDAALYFLALSARQSRQS